MSDLFEIEVKPPAICLPNGQEVVSYDLTNGEKTDPGVEESLLIPLIISVSGDNSIRYASHTQRFIMVSALLSLDRFRRLMFVFCRRSVYGIGRPVMRLSRYSTRTRHTFGRFYRCGVIGCL